VRDHRKLEVFQLADALVLLVYQETRKFPRDETFGLVSQMRRSAVSVAANIVEGCARRTDRDCDRFFNTAFGSVREVGYYIDLAHRLKYVNSSVALTLERIQGRTAAALASLIRSRKR
jgi:four helix bundle protein